MFVDLFEATDEINDFSAGVGAAGGGAKVRATTKWPILVDEAS